MVCLRPSKGRMAWGLWSCLAAGVALQSIHAEETIEDANSGLYDFQSSSCDISFANFSYGFCRGKVSRVGKNAVIEFYSEDTMICPDGLIVPANNLMDNDWRIVFYLALLLYLFLGIAMIADIFMSSIEVITSKCKTVAYVDESGKVAERRVLVWNETVSNLTLMALGSSAPEILLACIETVRNLGQPPSADGLGPSTIVGSAAFNLLVISGICIVCIPSNEVRRIKTTDVFAITAFFSVFAYLWIYYVLAINTKNVVDLSEALVTLAMFPLLVTLSYLMDAKPYASKTIIQPIVPGPDGAPRKKSIVGGLANVFTNGIRRAEVTRLVKRRRSRESFDPNKVAGEIAKLAYDQQKHSRLHYRINAVRLMKGGKRVIPNFKKLSVVDIEEERPSVIEDEPASTICFSEKHYDVVDNAEAVRITVVRSGDLEGADEFDFETSNGSAKAGSHFKYTAGTLRFEPHVDRIQIQVPLLQAEEDALKTREFSMRLQTHSPTAAVGTPSQAHISIINHKLPGIFELEETSMITNEGVGKLRIPVIRREGCHGTFQLKWKAASEHLDLRDREKAQPLSDFSPDSGKITFRQGETRKFIEIAILDDDQCEEDEKFEVEIASADDSDSAAQIGPSNKCMVTIVDDDEVTNVVEKVCKLLNVNMDRLQVSTSTWKSQFQDAMSVNGDDDNDPAMIDYIMHFLTFFWKVLFAFIPPTALMGGWITFVVAISLIGVLTAVVGDVAAIFGCTLGLTQSITAITFVALGTSLPDTFASMTAAKQDESADASIGNVTGSNSVNVFLGLGLPWTIASIYHALRGEDYEVIGDTLGFSVGVFCVTAILGLLVLVVRRHPKVAGGELGGPRILKILSAILMFSLWLTYVSLSVMQSYGYI